MNITVARSPCWNAQSAHPKYSTVQMAPSILPTRGKEEMERHHMKRLHIHENTLYEEENTSHWPGCGMLIINCNCNISHICSMQKSWHKSKTQSFRSFSFPNFLHVTCTRHPFQTCKILYLHMWWVYIISVTCSVGGIFNLGSGMITPLH